MFGRFTGDDEEADGQEGHPPESESDQSHEGADNGPSTSTGEPYQIVERDHTRVGGKPVITHTEEEGLVAGPHVRKMFESGVDEPEKPLWIGYDDGAQTGFREAPIKFNSLFRHVWIAGTTGYGKTTWLVNSMLQLAYQGHGFVYFDPKGKDSRELLQRLPKDRLDDVIWVEPGSSDHDRSIGLNFLETPAAETEADLENEIENRIENLKAIFDTDEYWGINMESITESMGRAMMKSDREFSVIDMYFILLNAERRQQFAEEVEDPFIAEFCQEIADMEDDVVRPLTKRIKSWVENAIIRRIIARRESTVDFREVVDEDRIVIVRTPVENKDIKKMVTLGVMRNVWSAIQRRSYEMRETPKPYFVFADEFDDIASESLDVESMLARARSMRLSVTLASQYPSQLEESVVKAMKNNCDNLVTFSVNDDEDAAILMKRFRGYTAEDLMSTDQYTVWTKLPLEGGKYSEPVKLRTFPPYPPLRSHEAVDEIIEESLQRYGADVLTDEEIRANLIYGEYNEILTPEDDDEESELEADAKSIPTDRILEGVFAAQIRPEIDVDDEGFVAIADAKREIERRMGDTGYKSQLSNVIEQTLYDGQYAEVDRRSGQSVVKLTSAGLVELFGQDTGSSASGGSDDHRIILQKSYEAFTKLGYVTSLPTQEGDELADGIADLPIDPMDGETLAEVEARRDELREEYPAIWRLSEGRPVNIEAETSTIEKPKQTLTNLRKAVNTDRFCVFALKDESATRDEFGYWGRRAEQVLYDSWRDGNETAIDHGQLTFASSVDDDGRRHFYNKASFVEFDDGVYALRPAYDKDTERSISLEWVETDDGVVCRDSSGTVHARFDDLEELEEPSTNAFPAYYEYDRTEGEFIVWVEGEKHLYNSREEFEADWKRVYAPFVAELEFDRMPTENDFALVVFPDGDNSEFDEPQIYEKGDLQPLHQELDIGDAAFDEDADVGSPESADGEEDRNEERTESERRASERGSEKKDQSNADQNDVDEFVSMMATKFNEDER
ncbi:type IV secretory pathway, VirD4 component [Halovivax ruber XH-70]|uniref:Type IV secretory pathway, VirD4 component n=1 Tax=Halovivax ruber (strain DSM 18193 / JCM 13892 / XH-70) TaxID=797302 RepID=L0IF49_HALRX|nr:type IV secretory system conjugative DNA transfer family protein [Halovivax ruber]AGB17379.1 type IV secretory pathway, VirD4 component [Halovivax ruber XH-70]